MQLKAVNSILSGPFQSLQTTSPVPCRNIFSGIEILQADKLTINLSFNDIGLDRHIEKCLKTKKLQDRDSFLTPDPVIFILQNLRRY